MTSSGRGGFDPWADRYEEALARGLALSGEGRDYFALRRIEFLAGILAGLGRRPASVLDFGCGTGETVPVIRSAFQPGRVVGVDSSEASIRLARDRICLEGVTFATLDEWQPSADFELAYVNGVFHHVPEGERGLVMGRLAAALRPGGLLSLWDNNPWNPGARLVMSRIPFDHDAVMLSARSAARLATAAGLQVLRVDHLFIFPRALRRLRPLEDRVSRWPLGAQYQVLCVRR
jgi:SAM-dependent methyltransferase